MAVFEHVVIGKGLIGSAAARYLSERSESVAILGPDEPVDVKRHRGVFSSHYDQGRLTRLVGRDLVYSKIAEIAIDTYPSIEERSGIRFHYPVGALVVESPRVPRGHMKPSPLETARRLGREVDFYEAGDQGWKERFGALEFPETHSVLYEPPPAGYINPRDLIRAQLAIAQRAGVTVLRETVSGVSRRDGGLDVDTLEGGRYQARSILVAAGAFTSFHGLLPRPLPFAAETETLLLARVSEDAFERLAGMPTVVYDVEDPELRDVNMTPPTRYPDGRPCIKIGANTVYDQRPSSLDEIVAWFREGDSDRAKGAFGRVLRSLWPGLELLECETRRCILCRTPSGYPILEEVDDRLFVAAGGNGGSAKGSDTLGRFAARLVTEPGFDYLDYVRSLI
jgi:sarcosine oxidase